MVTDDEAVLQDLKEHLQSKDGHGRKELLVKIGELEAEHSLKEGVTERALRLAGTRLSQELLGKQSSGPDAAGGGANGDKSNLTSAR